MLTPIYDDGKKQVLLNSDTDKMIFKGFDASNENDALQIFLIGLYISEYKHVKKQLNRYLRKIANSSLVSY